MTDRELRAVAEAMYGAHHDWGGWGDEDREKVIRYSQAAISASDSCFVKGLVEALKEIAKEEYRIKPAVPAWGIAVAALQQLPEDLL